MPESKGKRHRIFFALWPDDVTLTGLDQFAKCLHGIGGGRLMRRETLHLTLAFIGAVSAERVELLRQAAGQVEAAAFTLRLDRLGYWRHSGIAWAGCNDPPPQLLRLVGKLHERVAEAGLPLDSKDFMPHLTLLRNVHCSRCAPLPEVSAIDWPVGDFFLAESGSTPEGPRYRTIGRWPLSEGTIASTPGR